jgi:hypothetical protein
MLLNCLVVVDVRFELHGIEETDFHSLKNHLSGLLHGSNLNVSELADIVIANPGVRFTLMFRMEGSICWWC